MSKSIVVTNLSKKYFRGSSTKSADQVTLRDSLASFWQKKPTAAKLGTDQFWALENVSFEIKQGERVAIIGANGAGKSTLLKILSRISAPSSGEVYIKGRLGTLLEAGAGFHPELTGAENIYISGSILGMSKKEIDARFERIVAFSEMKEFLDMPLKHYSSGMNVKLGFAVAAHFDPEILLVDEALAVGDETFRKKSVARMKEMSMQKDKTVIFVSHDLSAVRDLCERGIVLEKGKLVFDGKIKEAIKHYG
jgi:lipopolysaccharide transport system ATP-binding protein